MPRTSSHLFSPTIALFVTVMAWFVLWSPSRPLTSPDEAIYLSTSQSFLSGRLSVPPLPENFATKTGVDGLQYPQYGPGLSALAAPWVGIGEGLARVYFGGTVSISPERARFVAWWASLFNGMVTALTAVLIFRWACRDSTDRRTALVVAGIYAALTGAFPHGRMFFSEPLAGLCILSALYFLLSTQDGDIPRFRLGLGAGALYALAVLTRLDSLAVAPPLFLIAALPRPEPGESGSSFRIESRITKRRLLGFAVPLLVAGALLAYYNHVRFGTPFSTGYEDQTEGIKFSTPLPIGLHGFLFSAGRSLFVYSPILVLAPVGFALMWRKDRLSVVALLSTAGFLLLAMSLWQNWAGGWDWGPRHLFQILPMLTLALAACPWGRWWAHPAKRAVLVVLVLVSFSVQLLGVLVDAVEVIQAMEVADPWALQFMVYDPLRGPPVEHFRALATFPPNLIWLELLRHGSGWCLVGVAPLITFVGALAFLRRWWRSERGAISTNS